MKNREQRLKPFHTSDAKPKYYLNTVFQTIHSKSKGIRKKIQNPKKKEFF